MDTLDAVELVSQLNDAKEELFNLRFQRVTGQLDNTARIGQVRRQVARIMTAIRAREIAEAKAQ
ncbi:MAG: 50S ribosomal protein L29 [Actinobacteria bacterium]|nr:50S ribosomal protein L29 [Actinomycetota bacterium]